MAAEIVDAHVHMYRSLALEKQNVVHRGRRDRDRWGNPDSIGAFMDREGISHILCLPNFPTRQMRDAMLKDAASDEAPEDTLRRVDVELTRRVQRQNDWLCGLAAVDPRLHGAVGVQKLFTAEAMADEVRRCAALGARAVKLLPGLYYEHPSDRAFWPMYAACEELGLTVVSDSGTLGGESGTYYGEPVKFIEILEAFPRLSLVLAHFPSAFWDQRVYMALRFPRLAFDISGGFSAEGLEVRDRHRALAVEDAVRVFRHVGVDRFMFGSDGPRFLFQPAIEQLLSLDLSPGEQEAILSENAKRIYGL